MAPLAPPSALSSSKSLFLNSDYLDDGRSELAASLSVDGSIAVANLGGFVNQPSAHNDFGPLSKQKSVPGWQRRPGCALARIVCPPLPLRSQTLGSLLEGRRERPIGCRSRNSKTPSTR
jgi:hypothetical protein